MVTGERYSPSENLGLKIKTVTSTGGNRLNFQSKIFSGNVGISEPSRRRRFIVAPFLINYSPYYPVSGIPFPLPVFSLIFMLVPRP